MKMLSGKVFPAIRLLFLALAVFTEPSAQAVVDFKEVTAVSAAIEEIYLVGRSDYYLPPGTDGQLAAETYPRDLGERVRWTIVDRSGDLAVELDAETGFLVAAGTSGMGWITVEAAAEGCAPKTKRIEIGCGCGGQGGTCDATAGAGDVFNGSVDVRLSLGRADQGRAAGHLILHAEEPAAILSTPEALVLDSAGQGVEPRYSDGKLMQIVTPQVVVSFVRFSPTRYEIHFYDIGFRGPLLEDGLYGIDPMAVPLVVWRIANPDAGGESVQALSVTEIRNGEAGEFFYSYEAADKSWSLTSGNGLKIESKAEAIDAIGDRVVRTVIAGPDGKPVKVEEAIWHEFAFGEKRVRETIDPDGMALATRYLYQTTPGPGYGKLKARVDPDGGWVRYDYDAEGRIVRETRPFLDAAIDAPEGETAVTTTDYTPIDPADRGAGQDRHRPRQVFEAIQGIETSRTYYAYIQEPEGARTEIVERCTRQGRAYGDPTNLRTVIRYYDKRTDDPASGRIRSRLSEDGRLASYTYEYGRFLRSTTAAGCRFIPGKGRAVRTTVTHGTVEHPRGIPFQTTRETTVLDAMGLEKLRETFVCLEDGYARIDWQLKTHDRLGRVIETLHANGLRVESTWGCCGKTSETTIEGIATLFGYDDLKRVISQKDEATGAVTRYTYDAAGRRLAATRQNDGLRLSRENRYDSAGRPIAEVDAAGLVTRYEYHDNRISIINPGGTTASTLRHLDGRVQSVTGTAVVPRFYCYGVDPDGHQWTTVYVGKADSPRWEKTIRDLAGRVVRVEKPGFTGIETTRSVYDERGRLIRTDAPGRAAVLYVYDALGNRTMTGLDVDGDGRLKPVSRDRIAASKSGFRQIEGAWWREDVQSVFAGENSAEETTVSRRRQRLTGWKGKVVAEQVAVDVHGNQIRTVETLDRFKHTRIQKVFVPDSILPSEAVYVDGRLAAVTTKTGITRSFGYDALGRRVTVEDPRKGLSRLHYDPAGRIAYTENAAGNRVRFAYDLETGRRMADYNALGKATYYAYSDRGQLIRSWGDVPYPVEYAYDVFGQMVEMRTFRSGTGWNGPSWPENTGAGDPTRWHYQPATGLLVAKEDAKGYKTKYTYGANGILATRTWARLKNGRPLVTAYEHDPLTGDLLEIDYSDDTVDIVFAYDRLGRKVRVSDAAGVHHFVYNDALQLQSEGLVGQQIYQIRRNYDDLGRMIGFELDDEYDVSYGYDDSGRFAAVDWRTGKQSGDVTYRYLDQSDLLAGMDSESGLSVNYAYEPHRDVKTLVENRFEDRLISRYAYQYDPLGRRINVKMNGEAFDNPGFWLYGYNDRNEVTSASRFVGDDLKDQARPRPDYERVYNYDPIGNRTMVVEGGEAVHYQSNRLNQYEAIDASGSGEENLLYDADGNLIEDDRFSYFWNAENRLVVVEPKIKKPGVKCVAFGYDYLGRRFVKKVFTFDGNGYQLSKTIYFVYDGWNIIKEITTNVSGAAAEFYAWGLDLSQSLQGAGGVGGLLASSDIFSSYYYMFDANGNVAQQINHVKDAIKTHEYEAYGRSFKIVYDDNCFQFSSKFLDQEINSLYYGYRYYSSHTGRWIRRDPIAEIGGINLYTFANNNALTFNDIWGLILYAFDGTGMDSVRDYKKGNYTNVYILYRSYPDDVFFAPGPGSSFGTEIYGGATGAGSGNRLKDAYEHFTKHYIPEADSTGKIRATIDILGFSRGAAIAREFANVLANPEHIRFEGYKGCPVPIRFVGLFDTVDMTAFIDLNLKLPDMVEHAAHAVAADERRDKFPLSVIDDTNPKFDQKYFTGDHSDIGRGHGKDTNFLSLAPLFYIYHQGISAGVPFKNLSEELYENFSSSITPHDLSEEIWYWRLFGKNDRGIEGAINGTY